MRAGISSPNSSRNSSGISVLQRRLDVGMEKVVSLKQQWLSRDFSQRVRKAVTEIQLGNVNPTAEMRMRNSCPMRHLDRHGNELNPELLGHLVKSGCRDRTILGPIDDNGCFEPRGS